MNILGCPLKLSSQNAIYFPLNYMRIYKLDSYLDVMIRQQFYHHFIYRPYCKRKLLQNEKVVHIRACVTYIPPEWIAANSLVPGKDCLYLIGIENGFIVSATEKIQL